MTCYDQTFYFVDMHDEVQPGRLAHTAEMACEMTFVSSVVAGSE